MIISGHKTPALESDIASNLSKVNDSNLSKVNDVSNNIIKNRTENKI